ncbi:unnamed protein product [Phytomonas sp. Hart1]|nr:unnamed protein product [Phytomonas sp. Hart1]|eukprot:CCW66713.1 unnamed protein product [Phytomonas sp. isolate Hart1]
MSTPLNTVRASYPTAHFSHVISRFIEKYLASVEQQSPTIFPDERTGNDLQDPCVDDNEVIFDALSELLPQWVSIIETVATTRTPHPPPAQERIDMQRRWVPPPLPAPQAVLLTAAAAHRVEALFEWPHLSSIPSVWRTGLPRTDLNATVVLESLAGSLIPLLRQKAATREKQWCEAGNANATQASAQLKTWHLWNVLEVMAPLSMLYACWIKLIVLYDSCAAEITTYATPIAGNEADEMTNVLLPIERFHSALKVALRQLMNEKNKSMDAVTIRGYSGSDFEVSHEKFDLAIQRSLFSNCCRCLGETEVDQEDHNSGERREGLRTLRAGPDMGVKNVCGGFAKGRREHYGSDAVASAAVAAKLWFSECCRIAALDDTRSFASDHVSLRVVEQLLDFLAQRTREEAMRAPNSNQTVSQPRTLRVGLLAAVSLDSPLRPAPLAKEPGSLAHEPVWALTLGCTRGDGKRGASKNRLIVTKCKPRRRNRRVSSSDLTSISTTDNTEDSTSVGSSTDDSDGMSDKEDYYRRSDSILNDSTRRWEDVFVGGVGARRQAQPSLTHRRPCQARLAGVSFTTGTITDDFRGLRFEAERHARGGTLQWLAPWSSNMMGLAPSAKLR